MNLAELRDAIGIVIPIWFSKKVDPQQVEALLTETMVGWESYVRSENIVFVLDGCDWCIVPLRKVQRSLGGEGWQVILKEQNSGKGGTVLVGLELLLEQGKAQYLVIRDSDNDHLLIDLPRLLQLGRLIQHERKTELLMVIGSRNSLHFPMSFTRGEWERIVDEVIIEAAKFALAKDGKVPDLTYCAFHTDKPPDFMSGYKLFTATSAALACRALRDAHERFPDLDLLRYGWEGVSSLAILLAGGILGEVTRLTYKRQPVSGYGDKASADLYGRQILYAMRTVGLCGDTVRIFFDNATRRSLLWTQQPQRDILLKVRQIVLADLNAPTEMSDDEARFF